MKYCCILLACILISACHNSDNDPVNDSIQQIMSIDPATLVKTDFELNAGSLHQTVQVMWLNNTSISAAIKRDSGSYHNSMGTPLFENHPGADAEIFEDSLGDAHPMREFTINVEDQKTYISLKIALDTSFAVLAAYNTPSDSLPMGINRVMLRKK